MDRRKGKYLPEKEKNLNDKILHFTPTRGVDDLLQPPWLSGSQWVNGVNPSVFLVHTSV